MAAPAVTVAQDRGAAPVLRIAGVSKRFGGTTVLDRCDLDVSEGEILTLLGPSGCGKTTLLRCVAGFWDADAGSISIDGRDMGRVPVNRRPVGVVFQSYALFPHLTVAQNVGYGLRMRGMRPAEIAPRVARALQTVALTGFDDRFPAQLSGGQQQRVAIARVLVLEPRVLLLDEPFNALDAKLRAAMQLDLRLLIKRVGITAIFVTHDQEEALTMSDRIAVMRAGRIEQVGQPLDVFDRPATAYVADFVGASNFWTGSAAGGWAGLPDGARAPSDLVGPVRVMTRPHNLRIAAPTAGDWRGVVRFHRSVGPLLEYGVETAEGVLRVAEIRQNRAAPLADGAAVSLSVIDPDLCAVYPPS
jgi:ABC-type Fe3+/spermidine/putrescine transport system ATPase subunit